MEDAGRIKEIEKTTNHDVKSVEYFIKSKLDSLSLGPLKEYVHFACTSEDINNLSYALMMKDAKNSLLLPTIKSIQDQLIQMTLQNSNSAMVSRTHGQIATPTTLGKELANYTYRIARISARIRDLQFSGKINGAVGNYNVHLFVYPEYDWARLTREFVEAIELTSNPYTTQIECHDDIAQFANELAHLNTVLIGLCRDFWHYISLGYLKQKVISGEVGSSTMPHKVNPIYFENCEGNLGLANSLLGHFSSKLPISRFQRDLTDSTVLRNIGMAFGYTLTAYNSLLKGLGRVEGNQEAMRSELCSHWELLAEPIQTLMRKHNIEGAYEKLKELSRGQKMNEEIVRKFIETLSLPEEDKERLRRLRPETYLGNSEEMAKSIKTLIEKF